MPPKKDVILLLFTPDQEINIQTGLNICSKIHADIKMFIQYTELPGDIERSVFKGGLHYDSTLCNKGKDVYGNLDGLVLFRGKQVNMSDVSKELACESIWGDSGSQSWRENVVKPGRKRPPIVLLTFGFPERKKDISIDFIDNFIQHLLQMEFNIDTQGGIRKAQDDYANLLHEYLEWEKQKSKLGAVSSKFNPTLPLRRSPVQASLPEPEIMTQKFETEQEAAEALFKHYPLEMQLKGDLYDEAKIAREDPESMNGPKRIPKNPLKDVHFEKWTEQLLNDWFCRPYRNELNDPEVESVDLFRKQGLGRNFGFLITWKRPKGHEVKENVIIQSWHSYNLIKNVPGFDEFCKQKNYDIVKEAERLQHASCHNPDGGMTDSDFDSDDDHKKKEKKPKKNSAPKPSYIEHPIKDSGQVWYHEYQKLQKEQQKNGEPIKPFKGIMTAERFEKEQTSMKEADIARVREWERQDPGRVNTSVHPKSIYALVENSVKKVG
jgi:hypothetical protein